MRVVGFIDFVFISRLDKYAFEIDGEVWHAPDGAMVSPAHYRDQLLRQNSLVFQGWKVYRWTDVQLAQERERIQQQLELFLEKEISAGTLDGFLPKQEASELSLREHQKRCDSATRGIKKSRVKPSLYLLMLRAQERLTSLLLMLKRLGLRTLYLAHRTNLLTQTQERFW